MNSLPNEAEAAPADSPTARITRDVIFAESPGFRPLTLDVHYPRPSGPLLPAVLFVHGGGWRLGSRRVFVPGIGPAESFGRVTAAGYALVSIDYRLSREARFPAPVEDVLAAVNWIRHKGAQGHLDASRIVLWGESSGAHLAALAAFREPTWVRGVVDWYGPSNLTTLGAQLHPDSPATFDDDPETREANLLGGPISQVLERARLASPALQVPANPPPFHVAHGMSDDLMPIAQSTELVQALAAVGADVEFNAVPGASHFWRGAEDVPGLFAAALAFADRVTAGEPSAE